MAAPKQAPFRALLGRAVPMERRPTSLRGVRTRSRWNLAEFFFSLVVEVELGGRIGTQESGPPKRSSTPVLLWGGASYHPAFRNILSTCSNGATNCWQAPALDMPYSHQGNHFQSPYGSLFGPGVDSAGALGAEFARLALGKADSDDEDEDSEAERQQARSSVHMPWGPPYRSERADSLHSEPKRPLMAR